MYEGGADLSQTMTSTSRLSPTRTTPQRRRRKNALARPSLRRQRRLQRPVEDVAPLSVQEEADEQIKKELQDAPELFKADEVYNAEVEEYASLI